MNRYIFSLVAFIIPLAVAATNGAPTRTEAGTKVLSVVAWKSNNADLLKDIEAEIKDSMIILASPYITNAEDITLTFRTDGGGHFSARWNESGKRPRRHYQPFKSQDDLYRRRA